MNHLRVHTLDEALAELARHPRRVLCGGTDVYADPSRPVAGSTWLDIGRVASLKPIALTDGHLRIGAAATWEAIERSPLTPGVLREAAGQVGSRQIRVQGTLGGNLCHASPIADGVPPLLALEAQVELASLTGVRRLRLDHFLLGRRSTALRPDELLTAVLIPSSMPTSLDATTPRAHADRADRGAFIKLANRDGMALATVSVALCLRWNENGVVARAVIAVGGASDVPVRLLGLEASLEGARPADLTRLIRDTPMPELSPIDDHRGSAALRRHLVRVAIERAAARCGIDKEVAHVASE